MRELEFTGGKRAMKKLSRVQRSIDKFTKSHKGTLSKRNHSTMKRLLKKRAKALSKATAMQIHSIFD